MSQLDPLPKCPRCSRPVRDNHRVVLRHGELLHEYCDLLLGSEARIRTTRKVIARTWEAIQRSARSLRRGALVLIIEPNPTVARELQVCVEGAGCAAATTHSGREALEITRSWRPDLVLLDLELPDDPLDDVIRKLLVAPARIIGISDRLSSRARTRAEGTGVALVLVRPIDYEELRMCVEALLARWAAG
jgi:CheY-like chemotaxis protein